MMRDPDEAKRWQFRLRGLFVFFTACAIATWILSNQIRFKLTVVLLATSILLAAIYMAAAIGWQLTFGWNRNRTTTSTSRISRTRTAKRLRARSRRAWIGSLWSTRIWTALTYVLVHEVWTCWILFFLPAASSRYWHALWHAPVPPAPSLLNVIYAVHSLFVVLLAMDATHCLLCKSPVKKWPRLMVYIAVVLLVIGKTVSITVAAAA